MRLFIGIELDEPVRLRAAEISDALRESLGRRATARWMAPGNLHITLWFIGEVDDDRAAAIARAFERPFGIQCFDIVLAGLGAFPPHGAPRVFWIGVAEGQEPLVALHRELATRLHPLGFEPERRPYSAHLTIARVKDVHARDIRNTLRVMPADAGRCRIEAVTLFRSRLSPKGATYEPLLRVALE